MMHTQRPGTVIMKASGTFHCTSESRYKRCSTLSPIEIASNNAVVKIAPAVTRANAI